MITINGRKMGKSYNNVIKLTELFSGDHPMLEQAYHPMVIRFYILQTHYRSTLDFSNEALQASEKALRRLWEAYEVLQKLPLTDSTTAGDPELEKKVLDYCHACADDMNDDFNTAKVIANLFELTPVINGIKGGQIKANAISQDAQQLMLDTFHTYLENILGLQPLQQNDDSKLDSVLQLVIEMRREARARKDYAASDKIRDMLAAAGIQLKDEKDGAVSYSID